MMAKKATRSTARRNVFGATFARFVGKHRLQPRPRLAGLRKMPLLHRFAPQPDPVSLAIFAIDCVGPAAVRACASGVEVRIAAPDETTVEVFRAALTETARHRETDRLIRIVVD
jgi:hypothetical protein